MKRKREKDRRPFRKATPEEDAEQGSEEEGKEDEARESTVKKTVKELTQISRIGEDTPFSVAGPEEWNEKPKLRPSGADQAGPRRAGA